LSNVIWQANSPSGNADSISFSVIPLARICFDGDCLSAAARRFFRPGQMGRWPFALEPAADHGDVALQRHWRIPHIPAERLVHQWLARRGGLAGLFAHYPKVVKAPLLDP